MRIDIDLDDNRMISSPGVKDARAQLVFKNATDSDLTVRFWRAGVVVELAEGATGEFGIKASGKYDGELLVSATSWTKAGTGADTTYAFAPNFNTEPLADLLFSGDADAENDVESIVAMAEIMWVSDSKKGRTQTVETIISNDVLKDSDGTPLALETPEEWLEERRPAPITRATAQIPGGNPNFHRYEIPITGSVTAGTYYFDLVVYGVDGALVDFGGSGVGLIVAGGTITATAIATEMASQLDAYLPSDFAVTSVGAVVYIEGPAHFVSIALHTGSPAPSMTFSLTTDDDDAVPTVLSQFCMIGDAGGNRLTWICSQITPFPFWDLVTAGIVWNETDEQWEKFVVRSGTIQSDLYEI